MDGRQVHVGLDRRRGEGGAGPRQLEQAVGQQRRRREPGRCRKALPFLNSESQAVRIRITARAADPATVRPEIELSR